MENFVVSARKYRPITFESVVGQSAITTTLKNAIRNNHLAQAFLFCGSRGVGKTTCARILAKTINCQSPTEEIEPCGSCDSCQSFEDGASLNIYELDAASNNSVEDIRHLIDQVRFAPQMGDFKVYIIDEVHMLSQAAFNAFLKTLEEPPAHAIFILATTEKHKIIPTILSRCQIFDFHRIQVKDIANHLGWIAQQENIEAEPDALHIIAQKADGALRDALSIFDQIVSFSGNKITYQSVIENLNILDYDYYFKVTEYILNGDTTNSLLVFNEILNNGFDGHNFINGLAEHFRNLLVCRDEATLQLLEVGDNIKSKYGDQSGSCTPHFLLMALELTSKCDINYKSSKNKRLLVELTLLQLCSLTTEKKTEVGSESVVPIRAPGPPLSQSQKDIQPDSAVKKSLSEPTPVQGNNPPLPPPSPSAPPPEPIQNGAAQMAPSVPQDQQNIVAEPAPQPEQKPSKKKTFSGKFKSRELSINDVLKNDGKKKGEEEEVEPDYSSMPKTGFDQEKLTELWAEYTEMVRKRNQDSLYSTLKKHEPALKENFKVDFIIHNVLQEEEINRDKPELLAFLREKLNNWSISLHLEMTEQEETQKLYTPRDKYLRMVEKNPKLQELKNKLDLDIDY